MFGGKVDQNGTMKTYPNRSWGKEDRFETGNVTKRKDERVRILSTVQFVTRVSKTLRVLKLHKKKNLGWVLSEYFGITIEEGLDTLYLLWDNARGMSRWRNQLSFRHRNIKRWILVVTCYVLLLVVSPPCRFLTSVGDQSRIPVCKGLFPVYRGGCLGGGILPAMGPFLPYFWPEHVSVLGLLRLVFPVVPHWRRCVICITMAFVDDRHVIIVAPRRCCMAWFIALRLVCLRG